MDLGALKIFLAVAQERSFLARRRQGAPHPAGRQPGGAAPRGRARRAAVRPSSKTGTLTEAGKMLQNYGQRLVRLAEETESAVRELRDLRRGRVLIGANEARVHTLLPLIGASASAIPTSPSTCAACRRGRSRSRCSRAASTSAR
jgi:DNA-binding transcriptional LysR family regulator